ncbi:ABC transporter substrate-binding protein [Neobacillus niacini]|uniref:ABC transporter substrate-binding protein n=1 Tax=Neobacillus niacini TaxID=86668 RepID=UPI002FFFAECC
MIKKNIIGLIIVTLLLLTACGAGGSKGASSSEKSQGVSDKEIIVGQIGAQSGAYGVYDAVRQGLQSYFNYVNEEGGVNGRKIKLIAYDDKFEAKTTVQNAKRLEENDKVFALVGNVGTIQTMAIVPYLEQRNLPLIGLTSGSKVLFNPPNPNIFGNVVNYTVEIDILVDYLIKEKGVKKIFVSYLNNDAGKETLDGIARALERYPDVKVVGEGPHLPTDTDFTAIAQKVKESNPDVVVMGSGPSTTANLKKELHKIGLQDVLYAASSTGGDDPNLFKLVGEDVWSGTISTTSIPSPEVSKDPEMKDFVDQYKKDFPKSSTSGFAMWGWAMGQIFVEAVKRSGEELTRENLKKQLETLDNWEGSLYPAITYTPDSHYGNTTIYITEAKDGAIVPVTKPITYDVKEKTIKYSE